MSIVIDDIRTDFREFWNLPIVKGGVNYKKSYFDELNASLLFERLAESSTSDDLAIVLPQDSTTLPLVIIESLLSLFKYDLMSSSGSLDNLEPEESVGLMRDRTMTPGIYKGTEYRDGKKFYRVWDISEKGHVLIPEERKWRIQPYNTEISAKRKLTTEVRGKVLEELAGVEAGGLFAYQNTKGLLVTSNKGKLKDDIQEISLGGDPIESIFPIADYSDVENYKPLLTDSLRRDFVLGLVSYADTAVDIALRDPKYRLLIIEGAAKVRSAYGSIERLNADNNPRKIICVLNSSDEEEISTLSRMGFRCWVWKRDDFKRMHIDDTLDSELSGNNFELHDSIISALSESNSVTHTIDGSEELDGLFTVLFQSIRKIAKATPVNEDAGIIIRRLYAYLKFFMQLPVTVKEYEQYLFLNQRTLLTDQIDELAARMQAGYGVIFPRDIQQDCTKIIETIKSIYSYLEQSNPRKNQLMQLLGDKTHKKTTIVCSRSEFAEILREQKSISQNTTIISANEIKWVPSDRVIVCGHFTKLFVSKTFLAPFKSLEFQLYKDEKRAYEYVLARHPASPRSRIDTSLRKQYIPEQDQVVDPSAVTKDNSTGDDLENLIKSVNERFGETTDFSGTFSSGYRPSADYVDARRIIFDNESFTYLNSGHQVNRIDRIKNEIERCSIGELETGDELIFTHNSRDLFDDLMNSMKEADTYKLLEQESSVWWRALRDYARDNNMDEDKLAEKLEDLGCKRHPFTIKQWTNGKMISPTHISETLTAIASLTGDKRLEGDHASIIAACKTLFALHIQTGRLLIRRIVSSAVTTEEDEEIDEETKGRIDAYAKQAILVNVAYISDNTASVPDNAIGQLFTAQEQL